MSFGKPTSAPQTGRLFLRSHGDCFIHATQWWLKYWNFSFKDRLAIVRVSLPTGEIFLATLSPAPLPYENVQKGVRRKQYLEIDPRFALELGIAPDTEVVVESIGAVEECISLVLAPLTPNDYDKLENFSEKIDYELTERIRVVSCRHSFPVWIDNLVVPVRVVRSEPSANWVLLAPGRTLVYLQRDFSSTSGVPSSTVSFQSTPGPGSSSAESPPQSNSSTTTTLSLPPTQQTAKKIWDFSHELKPRNGSRKKSSTSSRSSASTSGSSVDVSPTEEEGSDKLNHSLVSFSGMLSNYVGNWTQKLFSRESSQIEERPSTLELANRDKGSFGASLESTGFEPQCFPKVSLKEVNDRTYSIQEQGQLVTQQPSPHRQPTGTQQPSPHRQLMGEIHRKVPLVPSSPRKGSRATAGTPEPPPGASMSSGSEPVDRASKPSHIRAQTWHSSSDFVRYDGGSGEYRGSRLGSLPQINAQVRVQPHLITGVCSRAESAFSPDHSWCLEQLFDVFVHPSTIPEVFLYWRSLLNTGPFLVEIVPINPVTLSSKEGKSASIQDDLNDLKAERHSGSSPPDVPRTSFLPTSLVVRLCFATKIRIVNGGEIVSVIDDGSAQADGETKEDCISLEVGVNTGHVLMSDTVRQQLGIKTCSPVRLLHVKDGWRIPYTDKPSITLQPLKPEDKKYSVRIKNQLDEWIRAVCELSGTEAVFVDKQVIPVIRNEEGELVYCRVRINKTPRRISSRIRIQYLLVTPSGVEGHGLLLHVEPVATASNGSHLTKPVLSRIHRDPSPSKEEVITMPAIRSLNQPPVFLNIEHFRALEELYIEGVQYLETVFSQSGKGGTLLVCGVSGSGGSGCGKTTLGKLLCKAVRSHPHYANLTFIDCTALRGLTTHNFKKRLKAYFSEAILNQPSVILLDDLDHTMSQVSDAQEQVGEEGNASIRKSQVFLDLLELVRRKAAQVVVIAVTQNRQQLNKELLQSRGTHVFEKTLEITPPTLADRKVILTSILNSKALDTLSDQELRAVAVRTEGFQPGDLVTLVDRAISLCELRTLYPQGVGFLSPDKSLKWSKHKMATQSSSSSDFELSGTSPTKQSFTLSSSPNYSTPPSSPLRKYLSLDRRKLPDKNPSLKHLKKTSIVSTESTHTLIPEDRGLSHSTSLSQMRLCLNDFLNALKGFIPLSLRGLPLHHSGTIDFSGVGGLKRVKKCLEETLLWPTKYPRLFGQCPIKQRCGVLLYGAPGTGKTMLAGAVAKQFNLNFVSIKGPELLSKYIGASEQAVRDVFTRALCAKPCILFFDEFDSLAPRRGHDNTGVTDRVVNQLLTQLDGVEALQGVYVLAASSRPDLIDPALLRPGRIDRSLLCDMPTKDERTEILISLSKGMPLDPGVNLKEIASKAKGMTGADLKAVLYSAQLQAAHETLGAKQRSRDSSLTESLEVEALSTPNTSGRGSSIASGSSVRPLVFNFSEGNVKKMGHVSSSVECKTLALQRKGSFIAQQRRRPTLTRDMASDGSLFDKKKRKGVIITQEHLVIGLSQVKPSISKEELKKFNEIYDKFSGKTKTTLETIKPAATMA